ncbi:hypothetical protein EDD18DRAFT_861012 [Armillaria luteobubalina]|uniref:Uncharacterized protein n=1 Tax=Armillaria luteobubalina TaxID=153913 RepID=A0AA39QBA5_9AGAR|nr:hypothetical protein EDD18DRAFT_861012 [Armillaria luteobubalina]
MAPATVARRLEALTSPIFERDVNSMVESMLRLRSRQLLVNKTARSDAGRRRSVIASALPILSGLYHSFIPFLYYPYVIAFTTSKLGELDIMSIGVPHPARKLMRRPGTFKMHCRDAQWHVIKVLYNKVETPSLTTLAVSRAALSVSILNRFTIQWRLLLAPRYRSIQIRAPSF